MPVLRELPDLTLDTLRQHLLDTAGTTVEVPTDTVRFALTADQPTIAFRGAEMSATKEGVGAFGDLLQVPAPYLGRIPVSLQQATLAELIQHCEADVLRVTYTPAGIRRVVPASRREVDSVDLVAIAIRAMGTKDARIARMVNSAEEFAFDAFVPDTYNRGVGGDRQVGDLTAGGVRVLLDRKHNRAPAAQPFALRLRCTNGMEFRDEGLRIDARGMSDEDILDEFEAIVERSFSRVDDQIKAFYDLRSERIPAGSNPERELLSIGRDHHIPSRSMARLLDLAPTQELPDNPTRFDLVNLVTNLANDPGITNDGGRRLLERAGGAVVSDHAVRCGHCRQRVGAA